MDHVSLAAARIREEAAVADVAAAATAGIPIDDQFRTQR
jgi:hypothetical protein